MKKIGVLGSGAVGKTLAGGFLKFGYQVMVGTSNPEKLDEWKLNDGKGAAIGSFADAAQFGDIVVLAAKGNAALNAIVRANPLNLINKTVIDTTNPIEDAPPQNGVLKFFTTLDESLLEKLQNKYPEINFVKAFSCVGSAYMVSPSFPDGKPAMFICGNNEDAKNDVKFILGQFGFEPEDMGKAEAARAIEPLCMLWCIPGFLRNDWTHAFKVIKM